MTRTGIWLSAGALAFVVGAGGASAVAAQEQGKHRERVQRAARGDRQDEQRAVPRSNEDGNRGGQPAPAVRGNNERAQAVRQRDQGAELQSHGSWDDDHNGKRNGGDHHWNNKKGGPVYVVPAPVYVAPAYVYPPRRVIVPSHYPHHYGSGGSFSVFFGVGSGYRYGSPYYGPVYGYSAPVYAGPRRYYGDVRLQVRPRDAAVYVDGYYAGVVDDFDGAFQRLTVEVGPHEIEIERPGFEPQVFNVYADPTRTVDVRADLYPYR